MTPKPPDFHAEPHYPTSRPFIGRAGELELLSTWASASDPNPMLLFEATGGSGKSMLTWEWINRHATEARGDWAGRFWYSFYEKGAVLSSFCRHALAYMTGQSQAKIRKLKIRDVTEQLLVELKARPWLIVFDGIERILVAYNRSDAAQLSDEEADQAEDIIADRDPRDAIRPEDDELLRLLAGAAPSKLLITSRLIPHALFDVGGGPFPGVRHERLSGLSPPDAEALLRAWKIGGDSIRIRKWLEHNCASSPLVINVLAGLINKPATSFRGDFDAWVHAPDGAEKMNLGALDLTEKRNRILAEALVDLPPQSRALLSTFALLSESADADLLESFNPHASEVNPGSQLRVTLNDLENRGLLQRDPSGARFDLHPVVRSVVAANLRPEETAEYGQRVVDFFSLQFDDPYEEAETLEDLSAGFQLIRTLLRMGRWREAFYAYSGEFARALAINLEAHAETLALLSEFFPDGWDHLPEGLSPRDRGYLANDVAFALDAIGRHDSSLSAYGAALREDLAEGDWRNLQVGLCRIPSSLSDRNWLAAELRLRLFALELANFLGSEEIFIARLLVFKCLANLGHWRDAEKMWKLLHPMGRDWPRATYRPGHAEHCYARYRFYRGKLNRKTLRNAERLAAEGKNRTAIRENHILSGEWSLSRLKPELAAESFHEAARMARESGLVRDALRAETWLLLARIHSMQASNEDAHREAERISSDSELPDESQRPLAEIWLALEYKETARLHARKACRWAWADGQPWVRRYEFDQASAIISKLGEPLPDLPDYDPENAQKFDWEDDISGVIDWLKSKRISDAA
ncbi:MAG: hypothetical protein ACI8UO_001207 [Verrucomicrobiales bacterium]